MNEPTVMPAMTLAQQQAWHALMYLHDRLPDGWALIGGQLVHLHCAERGSPPNRPTEDVDTVVNVRAAPIMLASFTGALQALGFSPDTTGDGIQHRWRRDQAQIDVLIPEGVGERAASRVGAGGAPTLSAPGTTQALRRTETVRVQVGSRVGTVLRPTLVAALIGKAAARAEIVRDPVSARHSVDFVVLARLLSARDFRDTALDTKDRRRLRTMMDLCRREPSAMAVEGAEEALNRLARAARLSR